MKKKNNIYADFAKVKLCIESCNTKEQLDSAYNLYKLFMKYHTDSDTFRRLDIDLFKVFLSKLY